MRLIICCRFLNLKTRNETAKSTKDTKVISLLYFKVYHPLGYVLLIVTIGDFRGLNQSNCLASLKIGLIIKRVNPIRLATIE
jgi:hypothetical protein